MWGKGMSQLCVRPEKEARRLKDEGGRMKDEVKSSLLSLHPSSFRLHPFLLLRARVHGLVRVDDAPGVALTDVDARHLARVVHHATADVDGRGAVVGEDGRVAVDLHARVVHLEVEGLEHLRVLLEFGEEVLLRGGLKVDRKST